MEFGNTQLTHAVPCPRAVARRTALTRSVLARSALAISVAAILAWPGLASAAESAASASDDQARHTVKPALLPGQWTLPPPSSAVDAAGPEADPEPLGPNTTESYGPPSPKVRKGKLAEIGWTTAPEGVPPALDEAIHIATRSYPSAAAARAALRAAHSDVKAAKWLRFPSVSANVAYLDSSGTPEPQVSVEAPLWSGGRIGAGIRRAKATEDASSASYVETVLDLAQTVSATYFEVVRLTQTEQLLAESIDVHKRLVQTMERRVKQEVSPIADLELARSRASQIEQQFAVTKAQRLTSLAFLAELIADPAYDLGPVPYFDPELDIPSRDALADQSIAFDPTVRRLSAQMDVGRADLEARKSTLFPQLNAQYSYDEIFGSRVGLVVRAQTSGGLSQFSEVSSARLRIQAAQEQIRLRESQLRREIASDVIQYESAKVRAGISRDASDTAARVSASYMRQFIAGRRSWLDVMNALREAVTAQLGKVDSEVTVMGVATRMQLRSGRWRPIFDDDDLTPPDGDQERQAVSASMTGPMPGITNSADGAN